MNTPRVWSLERVGRFGGIQRLGSRAEWPSLPEEAVVSITYGLHLSPFQGLVNSIVFGLFILPGLTRDPNLLFAELHGDRLSGESLTLTVWRRGRAVARFRDQGAHGWAKRLLTSLVFGGQARTWFLTYRPQDGHLPASAEARRLAEVYGKEGHRGRVVRAARWPSALPATPAANL